MYKFSCFLFFAAALSQAPQPGTLDNGAGKSAHELRIASISGQVLSQEGKPVAKVKVSSEILDGKIHALVNPWALSDSQGHFAITHLKFGTYQMLTEKRSDGYLMLPECFYPSMKPVRVTLTEANPAATTNIQLPPEAGRIVGTISDSETDGVMRAGVKIQSFGNEGCWLGTAVDPNYNLQIPSNMDVNISFEAPGYRDWSYSKTFGGAALHVEPGETVTLDIKLARIPAGK